MNVLDFISFAIRHPDEISRLIVAAKPALEAALPLMRAFEAEGYAPHEAVAIVAKGRDGATTKKEQAIFDRASRSDIG